MSEFDLIRRFFTRATPSALLGVGDDAALLEVTEGNALAISCDMLVSGTHFLPEADPTLLGHKTLAVNLSDMAAMGATPRWATLAIALPSADESWLNDFSNGFFSLAQQHSVELIGGDTTRGPLNLSVTIIGEVPASMALRRSGARDGDEIWVSGCLGDAALALAHLKKIVTLPEPEFSICAKALHQPQPRVALGEALRGVATSAIDVSDGLLADLGHILEASKVGAQIDFAALPTSPAMSGQLHLQVGMQCILAGGDDYELCFTAPRAHHAKVQDISRVLGVPLTRIGKIVAGCECDVRDASGNQIKLESSGYDHFR
jgi:thiamine-monophosphate kinase